MASQIRVQTEQELAEFVASFYDDPYGFVMAMYPWGQKTLPDGSHNPLARKQGPEPWQEALLKDLGQHIRDSAYLVSVGGFQRVWRSAVASGHGVGKSALVAWLIQFFMATRVNTRAVVTANTAAQLETKTWPELGKWHSLLLCKHWFTFTSTSYFFAQYNDEQRKKNYMVNAQTVSDDNTEAFAGLHNDDGTVFIIADEASGISEKVFEVAEGALTDGEPFLFLFGNPTRPEGEFYKCFSEYGGMYKQYRVDSRQVSHTNKLHIKAIADKYGEDSDVFKVRVRGLFPDQAFDGFIGINQVLDAQQRELPEDDGAALIMAVDVARFGDDSSVISFRRGRDARSIKRLKFHKLPITRLADMCADAANKYKPDAIVIESTGVGAGLIDILRDRHFRVIDIHPGAPAERQREFVNVRAELWDAMKKWIDSEGCLPDDKELAEQLTSVRYMLKRDETAIQLEAKADMKARGLSSPDDADSLALTFAVRLPRRDRWADRRMGHSGGPPLATTEYDVLHY